jgi:hypothetical protein
MAKCDEGYRCCVCGKYVESIVESDLYLRYVIGLLDPELLHATPEKHIRCNPVLAQFIVDERFEPVAVEGDFAKSRLDDRFVQQRELLATRGWQRLHELQHADELSVLEFPLPEVIERMSQSVDPVTDADQ